MSLDFKEDSIHLIDVDHGFEDLIKIISVKLHIFIEEFSVEIISSIGRNVGEIALGENLLSELDFAIIEDVFIGKG